MTARHLSLLRSAICGLLLIAVASILPAFTYSQCNCITGTISDQNEKTPLANAVVSIISTKDSVLTRFTRSNARGGFQMPLAVRGEYMLMVTYPGYADFIDKIQAVPDSAIVLGDIKLIKKSELLESVIVHQQLSAIKIKGDTIEYRADSFLVNKGANVAELLKRLPGIQVDRNGNITAQGQKVNKVLVDGEEFFSDDPAIVTQTLAADYVKDVQVYDKKSDQAEFTGVDDGQRSRTINLKLKPDKKKGYFGKLNLGGGTSGKFDNSLMLNSFKGSRKLSAFGIMSNNDHNTLDWSERNKFGSSEGPEYDEESGYFMYTGNIDDEFDQEINSDEGLPTTWTGGLHYSDNLGDKQKVNADYRFMKRNLDASSATSSRYILPDTQYFNSQSRRAFSTRMKNILKGVYDLKIDSTSSVKLKASGSRMNANTNSLYTSRALNADSGLVNDNSRTLNSDVVKDNFSLSALWRKKLKKKGRTFSLNFDEAINNESLKGLLQSNTDYYSSGSAYKNELIDQKKENDSRTSYLSSRLVYTEPLSKRVFLSFNYGLSLNDNTARRNTFNRDPAGDYKFKDSVYSNDFRYNYVTNSGGIDLKINTKKLVVTFGGVSSYAVFNQQDLIKDSASNYSFLNFYPKALMRYTIGPQRQLQFGYYGQTKPPDPEQLQPVRQNTDPLNVQVGNPALRQEFSHNMNLSYNDYKILTNRNIYVFTSVRIQDNAISTSSSVDSGGKTTYRFINVKGNNTEDVAFGYYWKSKKLKLDFGTGMDITVARITNQLNGLTNINDNQSYMLRLRLDKYVENKFNFGIHPRIGYTYSRSSLRPDIVTKYFTTETEVSAWVQLPWKLSTQTNAYINTRQKTDVFDVNRNVVKWDANLSKKFGKGDRAELVFSINDILNQNIGFNRTATSNFITQNTYSTLRRFAMLNFIYNISKKP